MLLTLQLKYGSSKHVVDIEDNALICDLMDQAEALTGVPRTGQKLILNGKALTSLDHSRSLSDCRVTNNCKIMVLGKRFDPQGDEMYRRVEEVEGKSFDIDRKLAEVASEVRDIEDGYLAREHHEQALRGLAKRCQSGTEMYMRLLESLDGLRFEEHQGVAKAKRKSVAGKINASLDSNDGLLKRIEAALASSSSSSSSHKANS